MIKGLIFFLFFVFVSCSLTKEQEEAFSKQFDELWKATNSKSYAEAMGKMLHMDPTCIQCYVDLNDKHKDISGDDMHRRCESVCKNKKRMAKYF